jgi:hypothetical protein
MARVLDRIYLVFLVITLLFAALFDVSHFPFWPSGWYFTFGRQFEQWYINKFKDPIYSGLQSPNGWADGMFFLEQLQIPFWVYLVFVKGLPLKRKLNIERTLMQEFGMIVMGTELVVTVLICWFEIWSFETISVQERINLILLYSPWAIIPGIMVLDCMSGIKARVESAKTKAR